VSYKEEQLKFPTITVCAENGFKTQAMKEHLNMSKDYWASTTGEKGENEPVPKTVKEVDEWWRISTYSQGELVPSATIRDGKTFEALEEVNLTTIYSGTFGRCYSTRSTKKITSTTDHLTVNLSIPKSIKLVKVYLHDEEDTDIIITGNYPLSNFKTIILQRGMLYGLLVTKKIHFSQNKRNCQMDLNKCIADEVKTALKCYFPTGGNFVKGKDLCNNSEDANDVHNVVFKIIAAAIQCREPCEQSWFEYQKLVLPQPSHIGLEIGDRKGGNGASIYLRYKTLVVTESREVAIYDFNSILSSVGGSLGLFLGFSCFGTITSLIHFILKKSKRKRPH